MFTIVGDHHGLPHFTLLATLWARCNDPLYRFNSEPSILWTPETKRRFAHKFTMNHFIQPHVLRVDGGLKPPHLPPFPQRDAQIPTIFNVPTSFLPPSHARGCTANPAHPWAAPPAKNAFVQSPNVYPSTSHLLLSTQSKTNFLHMTVLQLSGGSYHLASPGVKKDAAERDCTGCSV